MTSILASCQFEQENYHLIAKGGDEVRNIVELRADRAELIEEMSLQARLNRGFDAFALCEIQRRIINQRLTFPPILIAKTGIDISFHLYNQESKTFKNMNHYECHDGTTNLELDPTLKVTKDDALLEAFYAGPSECNKQDLLDDNNAVIGTTHFSKSHQITFSRATGKLNKTDKHIITTELTGQAPTTDEISSFNIYNCKLF